MRNFWVGLAGGFIALVGFAGTASALVTITMLWDATGTSDIVDPTGSIVLNVYVNTGTGPGSTLGGTMTVDWSGAPELAFNSYSSGGDFGFGLPALEVGSTLTGFGAVSLIGPAPDNTAMLLGTITFDVTPGGAGIINVVALYTGIEAIQDLTEGSGVMDPSGFAGSGLTITRTPEPGTLSLLVMGLSGLYVVGRRRGR
jgi:hypothetical protein